MVEVVTFTGTFANTSKHGITTVLLSDVVDKFHHVNGLAHTGTAEQTDFTTFSKRANKVNNLNTSFKKVNRRRKFVELRGGTVNRTSFFRTNFTAVVNRTTKNVHNTAEGLGTNRYGDAATSSLDLHTTLQAFRRAHGNGTNHAVAQLLLYFEGQAGFGQGVAFIRFKDESFVNTRHGVAGELNVHHGADDLNDLSDTHGFSSVIDTFFD
ncbi:hypothetical protein EVA_22119 [gut metagenome]|uniref:Uncharacterized protein n=1 Tax=gut metagenome TaxID=749906 RepID=J9F4E4_9ZZZZ